jgi:glycine oxidase
MEVDFLLIGQGLAGTVLSHRLLKEGKSVLVIDQPQANNSSRIAAGLYNPITGKKMVRTWNADLLFPEIEPLYKELERILAGKFLYTKPIYRPFLSVEEQNEWMGYSGEPTFAAYVEAIYSESQFDQVNDPFGGVLLKNSGYLDINVLLDLYSGFLKAENLLLEERFEENKLKRGVGYFSYGTISTKNLVFCNGMEGSTSSFFSHLPFAPVKGEVLDMDHDFVPDTIVNRGVFRISLPNGKVRVGSTYSWHDLDQGPTERAKNELIEKLAKLIKGEDFRIVTHRTGIRPATKDRRPFLGKHPVYENVYIFNGFGAKGVSLIPYYSKVMLSFMLEGKEPEKEVNITRLKQT